MGYFTGTKGNTTYLINSSKGEAYSFNAFGQGISALSERDARIALMNKVFEVDIISILETPQSKVSNIYYNGYCTDISKSYIEVFALLRDKVRKVNSSMFKISHSESVSQILLSIVKGSTSLEDLSKLLNINKESWKRIE